MTGSRSTRLHRRRRVLAFARLLFPFLENPRRLFFRRKLDEEREVIEPLDSDLVIRPDKLLEELVELARLQPLRPHSAIPLQDPHHERGEHDSYHAVPDGN